MKHEVLSIEMMKRLTDMGIDTTDASFGYVHEGDDIYCMPADECDFQNGAIPTYDAMDLLNKLPEFSIGDIEYIPVYYYTCRKWCAEYHEADGFDRKPYVCKDGTMMSVSDPSLLAAAYTLLLLYISKFGN